MIAHVDADAFFASVIERSAPKLKGKPILALGMGGGCVIAASYSAKAYGVKTGMRLSDAKRLLPRGWIAQPVDFAEAHTASRQIESILMEQCANIEEMSVDEWYADLHGVPGGVPHDLGQWAHAIQDEVYARTALVVSVGVAQSKLLSKMASPYRKPRGIAVVHDGATDNKRSTINREEFLRSLPAQEIPGIGWQRSIHTEALGLTTAWDITVADPETIRRLFGRPGSEMQMELNGTSVHPVRTVREPQKSMSRCRSFPKTHDHEFIASQVLTHLTYMVFKMRRSSLGCDTLGVWLRDSDYQHYGEDILLPQLMKTEEQLLPYTRNLTKRLLHHVKLCTQTGVVLAGLRDMHTVQYSLFEEANETDRAEGLQKTLDMLRTRFGRDVVRRGAGILTPKLRRRLLTQEGS